MLKSWPAPSVRAPITSVGGKLELFSGKISLLGMFMLPLDQLPTSFVAIALLEKLNETSFTMFAPNELVSEIASTWPGTFVSVVARFGSEAPKKSPPCSLVWLRSCVYLPVSRLFELKLWSIRRTSWRVFCRSGAVNEKRFGARPAVVEAMLGIGKILTSPAAVGSMRFVGILLPGKGRPVKGSKIVRLPVSEKSPVRSSKLGTVTRFCVGCRITRRHSSEKKKKLFCRLF